MVDEFVAIVVLTALGAAGGFISSWMAFNASGEVFNGRKHGNALITGILTGLGLGAGAAVADPEHITPTIFFILAITTLLSAAGIDRLRSSGSQMVANNPTLTEKKENGTADISTPS